MKKLFVLLVPWMLCSVFVACGGGDKAEEPPKALKSEKPEENRQDLKMAAQRMIDTCCHAVAPYVVQTAAVYSYPQQAGPYASQIQPPQMDACRNDTLNFTMSHATYYGREADDPHAQQYLLSPFRATANCTGGRMMAAGIPVNQDVITHVMVQSAPIFRPLVGSVRGAGLPPGATNFLMAQGNAIFNY